MPMTRPLVLPLSGCYDVTLVGGKALGIARLMAAGFSVPPGICVTTEAYDRILRRSGIEPKGSWLAACSQSGTGQDSMRSDCQARIRLADCSDLIAECRASLQALDLPPTTRWAIRSSATNEDAGHFSFAGLYRTHLGVSADRIDAAIKDIWASLWCERVMRYAAERGLTRSAPSMAVVIQPMIDAITSGVAYSIHPVTGRSFHVVVNAVPGLAAPLVDGQITPDHYVVEMGPDQQPVWIRRRILAHKATRLIVAEEGLRHEPIHEAAREEPSLSDNHLFELARMTKNIEQALGHPIDLEWAIDFRQLWALQVRPITGVCPSSELTDDDCEWSRANLKETLPELPSPLGMSLLEVFMKEYIIEPYRRLGCHIPAGLSPTRVLQGRPYLNMTLFHLLHAQCRGDPSFVPEQMGGEPLMGTPRVKPIGWPRFILAGILMWFEMRRAVRHGPAWFTAMKAMAQQYNPRLVNSLSLQETIRGLDELSAWLRTHELTFGIVGGVAQCFQVLSTLLPRWLGTDWRSLSNAALQGQGTVISAQQIFRLAEVAKIARQEPEAVAFFTSVPWNPSGFRRALQGTAFLQAFEAYLEDYGHRGIGESDVMSPRFADKPEGILAILRTQIAEVSPEHASIESRQARMRAGALREIKRRMRGRPHRWWTYRWWYRRLCRFLALREANRHHLMYFTLAARRLLLHLGDLLVEQGVFEAADDVFFLTVQDRTELIAGRQRDWRGLIRARRAEREHNARFNPPDTIRDWITISTTATPSGKHAGTGPLSGIPISTGTAIGPVRFLHSPEDWNKVHAGDILVVSVIDPCMAPLFGIAGGLIAEMGGVLSHGAIIAREYGLPAVANVEGALTRLAEGEIVRLDAGAGTISSAPYPCDSSHA